MEKLFATFLLLLAVTEYVSGQCEETLTAVPAAQTFTSPGYPSNYPNNLDCTYIIEAVNDGDQVEVAFIEILTENCCDYIIVRDGKTSDSPIVGNFRGNITHDLTYISSFGAFYIEFESDDSVTSAGFQMEYRSHPGDVNCRETIDMTVDTDTRTIASPNYPSDYPDDTYCTWTLIASEDQRVLFTLIANDFEYCCDNLLIRDGDNKSSPIIAYIQGQSFRQRNYISSGNVLQIRFRSNDQNSASGFISTFRSPTFINTVSLEPNLIDTECGGELSTPATGHGNFTSPNYPRAHANELMCSWIITAQVGQKIRVWFSYVSTESCCDWIIIRDGPSPRSTKLGVISGYPLNFYSFISNGPVLRIDFNSDYSQSSRGFVAQYETYDPAGDALASTCGGKLEANATLQYFSSPNFPEPYNKSDGCIWVIEAGFGLRVRLHILGIITDGLAAILHIYNGESTDSPPLIRLAGKHYQNFVITSNGPFMTVHLEVAPNDDVEHGGFRATYEATAPELELPLGESQTMRDGKGPR
ncbi:scavenger receptor cysteine-rich domain-containing protein DMBT1-like [Clavelina lepadiformis]|uniref:CUB domain-containing protein n=1 Tax=Clavelina lepadiformis TaxID=159417 RepID=A0ABP0EZK3_CLALP